MHIEAAFGEDCYASIDTDGDLPLDAIDHMLARCATTAVHMQFAYDMMHTSDEHSSRDD